MGDITERSVRPACMTAGADQAIRVATSPVRGLQSAGAMSRTGYEQVAPEPEPGGGPVPGSVDRAGSRPGGAGHVEGGVFSPAPRHGHLWMLRDGTPAHVPPGRLVAGDDGRLACHLCGRWFTHLGAHLRRHGWTAARYRDAVGLPLHMALCSADMSGQIAARQKRTWDASPQVRARFEPGRLLARTGELSRLSAEASTGQLPDAVRTARARRLAAGRATQATERQARVDAMVAEAGVTDLHALLRARYADGFSLDRLGRLAGLGRTRLRAELVAAGVEIRPSGTNQLASKQARADRNDALAAAEVGTPDIRVWLLSRYELGATLRGLARQVNRSIPWVRSRLADASGHQRAGDGDAGGQDLPLPLESGQRGPSLQSSTPGQVWMAWGQSLIYPDRPRVRAGRRSDPR
jgi:hypothetical protein